MTGYIAPLGDIRFALNELAGLPAIAALPAFQDTSSDLVEDILEEASKGDLDGAVARERKQGTPLGWTGGRCALRRCAACSTRSLPRTTSRMPSRSRSSRDRAAESRVADADRQSWCTENGVDIASTAIQVHGGMAILRRRAWRSTGAIPAF
ncbi:acyl-CoA dehydrogenase N-terminal domain-containing protein [Mesorhizobium australafricanum]|uniref:acyl-CoA dehydrogenase N-terminal domain-containing protein n=1 Tax=Mesorhizobium australafricanum TaxID=3072311 RepID=UPI003D312707